MKTVQQASLSLNLVCSPWKNLRGDSMEMVLPPSWAPFHIYKMVVVEPGDAQFPLSISIILNPSGCCPAKSNMHGAIFLGTSRRICADAQRKLGLG